MHIYHVLKGKVLSYWTCISIMCFRSRYCQIEHAYLSCALGQGIVNWTCLSSICLRWRYCQIKHAYLSRVTGEGIFTLHMHICHVVKFTRYCHTEWHITTQARIQEFESISIMCKRTRYLTLNMHTSHAPGQGIVTVNIYIYHVFLNKVLLYWTCIHVFIMWAATRKKGP